MIQNRIVVGGSSGGVYINLDGEDYFYDSRLILRDYNGDKNWSVNFKIENGAIIANPASYDEENDEEDDEEMDSPFFDDSDGLYQFGEGELEDVQTLVKIPIVRDSKFTTSFGIYKMDFSCVNGDEVIILNQVG